MGNCEKFEKMWENMKMSVLMVWIQLTGHRQYGPSLWRREKKNRKNMRISGCSSQFWKLVGKSMQITRKMRKPWFNTKETNKNCNQNVIWQFHTHDSFEFHHASHNIWHLTTPINCNILINLLLTFIFYFWQLFGNSFIKCHFHTYLVHFIIVDKNKFLWRNQIK